VILPHVFPWVKERHNVIRLRVDGREIRAFVQIAAITREGEIGRTVVRLVLLCHHMFDVEGDVVDVFGEMAVLAPLVGAMPDELPDLLPDHDA
jgi:hypothetical protein